MAHPEYSHRLIQRPWPGLFITFEGGEGAGKSSLMASLSRRFQKEGRHVLSTREPGGTVLGERLREILLHLDPSISLAPTAELCLFLSARAQHISEKIRPALEVGAIVLCDRFNDSSIAYQGVGRELGVGYVQKLCNLVCKDIEPDLTFYLDVSPEEGLRRAHTVSASSEQIDRIEQEEIPFHRRIREAFLTMAEKEPSRFRVVDAHQSPDEVFTVVCASILDALIKSQI